MARPRKNPLPAETPASAPQQAPCPACEAAAAETASEECCRRKERSPEEYKNLIIRLNRIEGQIRGIRKMVENDVYCIDILVQVSAVTSALHNFTRELLAQHIGTCIADDLKEGKDEKLNELLHYLPKFMQ